MPDWFTLRGVTQLAAQEVLPFPEPPSASEAGKTLKDSKHQWRKAESHLPKDAPNIVIFMTDDAGFSNPETFGGSINMPTMDRLAASGIAVDQQIEVLNENYGGMDAMGGLNLNLYFTNRNDYMTIFL